MIEIKMLVDNKLKVVAGNPYGREIYEKCLKDVFSFDDINVLVFPENVRIICSSFIQGLFSKYLEKYTPEEIDKLVKVIPERLDKNLKQGLYE